MKRLIKDNLGPGGTLCNDKFAKALMEYRNTPDRDSGCSPEQVVFGRPIRDAIPMVGGSYSPRPEWILTAEAREKALAKRHLLKGTELQEHTKVLDPLVVGDVVMVQNQRGVHARKWDKSGRVLEVLPHLQYNIKMDGTGRVTLRARQFLQRIVPYSISPVVDNRLGLDRDGVLGQGLMHANRLHLDGLPSVFLSTPQVPEVFPPTSLPSPGPGVETTSLTVWSGLQRLSRMAARRVAVMSGV
jgi:hypothetical protein